jgi:hypothetical protein
MKLVTERRTAVFWFGPLPPVDWRLANHEYVEISVPIGKKCTYCAEPFRLGESGLQDGAAQDAGQIHLDCHIRVEFGTPHHQSHQCACFVSGGPACRDLETVSKREGARAAARWYWAVRQRDHDAPPKKQSTRVTTDWTGRVPMTRLNNQTRQRLHELYECALDILWKDLADNGGAPTDVNGWSAIKITICVRTAE